MLGSCRLADTTSAANEAAAVRYGSEGAEIRKVLDSTTAGFPMPCNNSRDINSKDSLINYLRHPAGLLCDGLNRSVLVSITPGKSGFGFDPGVSEQRSGRNGSANGERN